MIPGRALEPLREVLRSDSNVVRAWWGKDQIAIALEDVSGEIDEYKPCVEQLSESVLSLVSRYGVAFTCGPTFGLRPPAGAVLVYERDDA